MGAPIFVWPCPASALAHFVNNSEKETRKHSSGSAVKEGTHDGQSLSFEPCFMAGLIFVTQLNPGAMGA